jgi:hypothetical protein
MAIFAISLLVLILSVPMSLFTWCWFLFHRDREEAIVAPIMYCLIYSICIPVFLWGTTGYHNAHDNKEVIIDKVVIVENEAFAAGINLTKLDDHVNYQNGDLVEITKLGASNVGLDFTDVISVERVPSKTGKEL